MAASQVLTANPWDKFLVKGCWREISCAVAKGKFLAWVFTSECTLYLLLREGHEEFDLKDHHTSRYHLPCKQK